MTTRANACATVDGLADCAGKPHRALRDLARCLNLSLTHVVRAAIECCLERPLNPTERARAHPAGRWGLEEHIGDAGTLRTDWIADLLAAADIDPGMVDPAPRHRPTRACTHREAATNKHPRHLRARPLPLPRLRRRERRGQQPRPPRTRPRTLAALRRGRVTAPRAGVVGPGNCHLIRSPPERPHGGPQEAAEQRAGGRAEHPDEHRGATFAVTFPVDCHSKPETNGRPSQAKPQADLDRCPEPVSIASRLPSAGPA
jgi:hypothetical protein